MKTYNELVALAKIVSKFKSMKKMILHKGIECYLSEFAEQVLNTDETIDQFLAHFLKHTPINSIKWVTFDELSSPNSDPENELPMYTVSSATATMLIWPILDQSNLHLFIENLSERPDLEKALNLG